MILVIVSITCLAASAIGAAVGIGGGIIIKPVLELLNIMDITVVSFLSGVTVLSMSTFSVVNGQLSRDTHINIPMALAVSSGAVIGGIAGKIIFAWVLDASGNHELVGAVQSVCLFMLTLSTFIYSLFRNRIPKYKVGSFTAAAAVGLLLGLFSSFLGIGGGPINIMILCILFSFDTKSAAAYSLFIIMCSQMSSVMWQILTYSVPEFSTSMLMLMALCGVLGGVIGTHLRRRMRAESIDKLFNTILVIIMCICVYNYFGYTGVI